MLRLPFLGFIRGWYNSGIILFQRVFRGAIPGYCGQDWPKAGYTMVGLARLGNIAKLVLDVVSNQIPGDFAELGVWRGGSLHLLGHFPKPSGYLLCTPNRIE